MDNNELLNQISSIMERQFDRLQRQIDEQGKKIDEQGKKIDEQGQKIDKQGQKIEYLEKCFEKHVQQIDEKMESQRRELIDMMDAQTQKLSIMIENGVTKRIDALFDARDVSLEKDKELESRVETLEKKVDDIQTRFAILEIKTANAT